MDLSVSMEAGVNRQTHDIERDVRIDRRLALSHLGFSLERHGQHALLCGGTLLMLSLIFAPISIWPLTFVCLVPWCIMVGTSAYAPRVYLYSFLTGLVFFLWNMRWLRFASGYGYVALSGYLALYFLLAALPLRHAVRRRAMPIAMALPIIWTGGELLRAVVMTGFPWFFLSHSLYKVVPLIQVSDLVGAYGVTFIAAAVNGAIVDVILARVAQRRASNPAINVRRARVGVATAAALLLGGLAYGAVQLARTNLSPGPRVATIQGDFLSELDPKPGNGRMLRDAYFAMMEAASAERPDLYLLPESAWPMWLNAEARHLSKYSWESYELLREFAAQKEAYVVVGSGSHEPTPLDVLVKERNYNSAFVFPPDGSEPARYDKVHLVYFGEAVPFRFGRLRFLYTWLNSMVPFSEGGKYEFSLFRGSEFKTFDMQAPSRGGATFRFGVPICYEDVMPYISRAFVGDGGAKRADFLLNISNDGWFGRGTQQPQHLAVCTFRAVENRVPIVRAVNTGVSAIIESTGRIRHVVRGTDEDRWPNDSGIAVAELGIDPRFTWYTRLGDWFAWSCVLLGVAMCVDYVWVRAMSRRR